MTHASPARTAWRRFRANRLGYWSLIVFTALFALSLVAEVISNDKPLVVRYEGQWYFPVFQTLPETTFGGVGSNIEIDTIADARLDNGNTVGALDVNSLNGDVLRDGTDRDPERLVDGRADAFRE